MISSSKVLKAGLLGAVLSFASSLAFSQQDAGKSNLKYIDPTIGNVGHLLQPTRPTVQLPNQMIRVFPLREDYMSDQITAFPLNVVSHRLGEVFAIKPSVNRIAANSYVRKMTYDHDLEITRPWYYSTYLIDDQVKVEFVPGNKVGIFRFSFPEKGERNILFSLLNDGAGSFQALSDTEIIGSETYHGNIAVYFYGKFNEKPSFGILENQKVSDKKSVSGKNARAFASFAAGTGSVELSYAVSYISPEQAQKNYLKEFNGADFSQLKQKGEEAWSKVINKISVTGGTEAQKRTFYTSLYRSYERMVDITEDGQYFSGFDNKVHKTVRPFYTDDWAWDTYLAQHPLRTILAPAQEEDMLNSYVSMYEQGGWMPTFPVLFGDHACMNGFHSTVVFLDAYRKGLKNYNVAKAYEGLRKNSTDATMLPWRNGPKGPLDDFYHKNGYFPSLRIGEAETDTMVHKFEKRQAVAVTLGQSYDDWALGQLAKDLGKDADYSLFDKKADNYKNLWEKDKRMFMPKDSEGNWIKMDPKFDGGMGARDYYDENNGFTYKWQVQHDLKGLVDLIGGEKNFENDLDQLFREGLGRSKYAFWAKLPDATGLVGQFSMGNEPSFHIPYLYNLTGAPWKTQKRIRFLLDTWFKDNVFGIPGDEDGGGMTSFVVFSSLGFYPLTPGLPVYTIGSPLFEKSSIRLDNGKTFTVNANGSSVVNKYIQSAKLNGKVLDTPWFTHDQLVNGGTLELEMGPYPNREWGVAKNFTTQRR
ncbi:GH92 family glycosyl hydrolase [Pedobacter sp. R-06]|uniref:GH92 family glycosyl hydrolase n=1 Tax=Pedobacter sp. R-06 TaxID=3404051 RepID=UPI003CF83883